MTWKKVKLSDLGIIKRGKSKHRPRNASFLYGGKYPFVQTSDIKNALLYIKEYSQTYSEEGLKQSKLWNEETLCITIAANIAESAILKIKSCFPDSIVGFTSFPDKSDVKFVKYLLDYHKTRFQNISKGTTQDNLSVEKINSLELLAPDLQVQQIIASMLSAYDELIENNTHRIKILEELAQTNYQEWFVNFRFPGHEKVKFVDIPLGKIPEGWEGKKIDERFATILGGTPSRERPEYWNDGTIPWINSGKVNEFRIMDESEFITELGLKKSATKLMPKRTTVIAITGATLGQVSLTEIEVCANQSVVGIYDSDVLFNEFIYLKFCEIIQEVIQSAGGGAQQHINKDIVNRTEIVCPDVKIIKNFNKIIIPLFDEIKVLLLKNHNLRKTRDLLLPKLMSGEVGV